MKTLGNILWHFPLLGFLNSLLCLVLGGIFILTVAGAPLGRGLLQLSKYFLDPFTRDIQTSKEPVKQHKDLWNVFGFYVRILYFPLGLVLLIFSLLQLSILFLSIVGIPGGKKIWGSLFAILNPVNKVCISPE